MQIAEACARRSDCRRRNLSIKPQLVQAQEERRIYFKVRHSKDTDYVNNGQTPVPTRTYLNGNSQVEYV